MPSVISSERLTAASETECKRGGESESKCCMRLLRRGQRQARPATPAKCLPPSKAVSTLLRVVVGLHKNNADSKCISLSAFRDISRNGERASSMKKGEREARRILSDCHEKIHITKFRSNVSVHHTLL